RKLLSRSEAFVSPAPHAARSERMSVTIGRDSLRDKVAVVGAAPTTAKSEIELSITNRNQNKLNSLTARAVVHIQRPTATPPGSLAWLRHVKSSFLDSTKQGQFQPLPVAVNILKSDFTKPSQLRFNADQLIRRVLIRLGDAEQAQKSCV